MTGGLVAAERGRPQCVLTGLPFTSLSLCQIPKPNQNKQSEGMKPCCLPGNSLILFKLDAMFQHGRERAVLGCFLSPEPQTVL